jgi:hypothetical protein
MLAWRASNPHRRAKNLETAAALVKLAHGIAMLPLQSEVNGRLHVDWWRRPSHQVVIEAVVVALIEPYLQSDLLHHQFLCRLLEKINRLIPVVSRRACVLWLLTENDWGLEIEAALASGALVPAAIHLRTDDGPKGDQQADKPASAIPSWMENLQQLQRENPMPLAHERSLVMLLRKGLEPQRREHNWLLPNVWRGSMQQPSLRPVDNHLPVELWLRSSLFLGRARLRS